MTPNENIKKNTRAGLEVAVIGMAGRFPGSRNIHEFWENLKNGVESISFFSDEEMEKAGVSLDYIKSPKYVKAAGVLEGAEYFDASFFGYTPKEAEIMNPEIRFFHECAWEALEDAGYNPGSYDGLIGVYAGASSNFYWEGIAFLSGKTREIGNFAASNLTCTDFLTTLISYKLNLKGPSAFIQTACSTSLAAIHWACRSVLSGESHMALAGGVKLDAKKQGYMYEEGMILSPDGHCRAFSAEAGGTVGGNGIGIVILKRLKNAIADRDHIYAVIKGSAVNNDGNRKVGYTAPSILGQAEAIRTAQAMAYVEPESIGYIETHGTATPLGDPVEIEALTRAFNTGKRNYCPIGSVKTNIGHLDTAAGVAGFIKTVLALYYKLIPPSLHFKEPNPKIDFKNSPFFVNNRLTEWKNNGYPRRAGVSSFGIGGTNAHVVLEEAPTLEDSSRIRTFQPLLLSAKTQPALERMTDNLIKHLKNNPGINFSDTAYTLAIGRKHLKHRKITVCSSIEEAIEVFASPGAGRAQASILKDENTNVVFMFPGQGSQYIDMGLDLYRAEPVFRQEMDCCFDILKPLIDYDIKGILYPSLTVQQHNLKYGTQPPGDIERINQTEITQVTLFVFEYALAKLLIAFGIEPYAMIGHSIGEYTSACLSGVFSLEDALKIVVLRGKLMQEMPPGSMLSIPLAEEELTPLLDNEISLAAVNSSSNCVVSGNNEAIDLFEIKIKEKGYDCTRLQTSHAFHSVMMDPILEEFEKNLGQIKLNKPKFPYISNLTGKWITDGETTNPRYWRRHLRETVLFSDGVSELLKKGNAVFLEVGPGKTLSTFVRNHKNKQADQFVINLIRHPKENIPDDRFLLAKIGQLWLYGINIDWSKFYLKEKRRRIPLPTYPFERQLYELDSNSFNIDMQLTHDYSRLRRKPDIADWFYIPSWKRSEINVYKTDKTNLTDSLVFLDDCGFGSQLVKRLEQKGQSIIIVKTGKKFAKNGDKEYIINPKERDDYDTLFSELLQSKKIPGTIIHLWNITKNKYGKYDLKEVENVHHLGFHSLIYIAQAFGKYGIRDEVQMKVVTNNIYDVMGGDLLYPERSTIIGPVKSIRIEYPNIDCSCIDLSFPDLLIRSKKEKLLDQLMMEVTGKSPARVIAYRNNYRWVQTFEPIRLEKSNESLSLLRREGVYLITGGLGGIGLILAEFLVKTVKAKIILIGRSEFPPKDKWEEFISTHDKDNTLAQKIQKIKEFEQSGSEVLVFSADVTNKIQMRKVIRRVIDNFGLINGVIHTAGIPDGEMIQRRTREKSETIFAPKIMGTLVLNEVLKDIKMDFFILCSSINSILAAIGQVAYTAANAFQDAFAIYNARKEDRKVALTISINWDRWQNTGMATIAEKLYQEIGDEKVKGGITSGEAVEAFNRILGSAFPQIAVTNNDLKILNERSNIVGITSFMNRSNDETLISDLDLHRRPELTTPYVPPNNEIEQRFVEIFEEFFGIHQVGINDNFFELGGDSLKAVILTSKINKKNYSIALTDILVAPTIRELAMLISEKNGSKKSAEDLYEESLLGKLECIEKLNKGRNNKKIFILHPLHGMVNQYKELALLLEQDYNVYGVQAKGLKPGSKMSGSPGKMINDYLEQILAVQKSGDYIIGGYCIGTVIAYEIVIRLENMGNSVEKLILFDQGRTFENKWLKIVRMLEYFPGFTKNTIHKLHERKFKKSIQAKNLKKIDEIDSEEIIGDELRKEKFEKYMNVLSAHVLPLEIIKAPILSVLGEASIHAPKIEEGFNRMTKSKATVIKIPGDHDFIFEKPYVENLAEIIKNM